MTLFLPHFLIIGAMKSGTTGLYDDLATHPDVWLPRQKEPEILHRASTREQACLLYRKHFAGAPPNMVLGEASTGYTKVPLLPDVSEFARDVFGPRLKLVYIMREPLERILSHVAHDYCAGQIQTTNIDQLILEDPSYLALSDYAAQLSPWIEAFGTKNILCLAFEDYMRDRESVTRKVASFLGLKADKLRPRDVISNPRGSSRAARWALVNRIVASDVYRYGVARAVPRSLLSFARLALTHQRKLPPIEISDEARARLREHFSNLGARLESLGVGRFQW